MPGWCPANDTLCYNTVELFLAQNMHAPGDCRFSMQGEVVQFAEDLSGNIAGMPGGCLRGGPSVGCGMASGS